MCQEIVRDLLKGLCTDGAIRSDNPLTFTRRPSDTRLRWRREPLHMSMNSLVHVCSRWRALVIMIAIAMSLPGIVDAQYAPYISGGGGFITSTKGGNTTYIPVIAPELVASVGDRLLVESRAT